MIPDSQPLETPITTLSELRQAVDDLIEGAQRTLRIFDRDLADGGYNSASRFERLRGFLLRHRTGRIEIVVHNSDYLERHCPRMLILLRQFPHAISIHRTLEEAKRVYDSFAIADDKAHVHRFHFERARGIYRRENDVDTGELLRRFEEVRTASEPALSPTILGL